MLQNSVLTDTDDDQELVYAVKQGSQQCLGKLYDKYAPALMGIISRISDNEKMAEEILNTAFVKIWKQAVHFDASQNSLFTWLINISRQTAFEKVKSVQLKTPVYITAVHEDDKKISGMQSFADEANDMLVFNLVYFKGLSCSEVATLLNITVDEVKNNIKMTIKNLKRK